MEKKIFSTTVIVGHGSIGKVHALNLSKLSKKLIIVDPASQKLKYSVDITQIFHISDLKFSNNPNDLIVISNWGPDHLTAIQNAANKGYKQFLIEKPMVTSLLDLNILYQLITSKSLKVVVNQGWHYENLSKKIENLGEKLSLGNVQSIVSYGGARCLSTGGSHVIHLANLMFKDGPILLNACLNFDFINPRSKSLIYVDGNAFIKFGRGSLCLNYNNKSSVAGETKIFWEEAIGTLDGTTLTVDRRNRNRKYRNTITRYGRPDIQIYSGDLLSNKKAGADIIPPIYKYLSKSSVSKLLNEFDTHVMSNKILICCLIASKTQQSVIFKKRLSSKLTKTKFEIS